MYTFVCTICRKEGLRKNGIKKYKRSYCSIPCRTKGLVYRNMSKGKSHYEWKEAGLSYRGIHMWVQKNLGKPHECTECGRTDLKHRQYHWANVSGEYKRDVNDWKRLCVKCHLQPDFKKIIKKYA